MRSVSPFAYVPLVTSTLTILFLASILDGCCPSTRPYCMDLEGVGGGQDSVTIDMPFTEGYRVVCSQGAGGEYSHHYDSTYFDVDFDTPNDAAVPLYAPVGGTAYVHDADPEDGFGIHVNIDIGDGTYIVLGHMSEVFVDDQSDVAAGQLLGYEGTTGASTGDHVHVGRHDGDAAADAEDGASLEGLAFTLDASTDGEEGVTRYTTELTCDLPGGHVYGSRLATPKWHPDGSLVKTPDAATVYLLEAGVLRPFIDEEAFWSRGYDFGEVALIDEDELACYAAGDAIDDDGAVEAFTDGTSVWIVTDESGEAHRVPSTGWQAVLKSWGITAATYDDLPVGSTSARIVGDDAVFRDGALVSELSSSAVYVVSGGIAMPVATWDAYLLMGFEDRTVIEVDDGTVDAVMDRVGDCATNAYCVDRDDILTCGGPSGVEATYDETTSDDEEGDVGGSADGALVIAWQTPGGMTADRITLSGETTRGGAAGGWATIDETADAASILTSVPGFAPGDRLRFSVEFEASGAVSWSCLAPYPPGTVQGSVAASWNGSAMAVTAADDPSSDGCGLVVTVSE